MVYRRLFLAGLLIVSATAMALKPKPLIYNGDTLPETSDFRRTKCGTLNTEVNIIEVSGIACSRVTPGYLWMQSDEIEKYIIATDEKGDTRYMTVNFSKTIRWDWEDMSGGVYEGKNYLFIGAFGDNEHTDGNYSIVYFEEPAITPSSPSVTIKPSCIKYQYPDMQKHNAEALMYDNIEQVIYIITKVYYDVCQVFSLPFRLDYGDEIQTLTYVCDLGVRSDIGPAEATSPWQGFHLVTAADISPDGKYILIKNHNNIDNRYGWTLLFTREGDESVSETVKRQPVVIDCYQPESQGEAICWLDSTTFYTTSDSDGWDPPIYKYVRRDAQGIEEVNNRQNANAKVFIGNTLYIRSRDRLYTIDGRLAR